MKKLLLLVSMFAILLTSCSSDDNASPAADLKIKNMTLTTFSDSGPFPQTVNFHYENGMVTGFDNGAFEIFFSYNNGNLVLAESYNDNNVLDDHIEFSYIGSVLDSVHSSRYGSPTSKVKLHQSAGKTIQIDNYGYLYESGLWIYPLSGTDYYTWQNGNAMRWDEDQVLPEPREIRRDFTYDAKNNPFKNMDPVIKHSFSKQWGIMSLSDNNQLSETYYASFNSTTPLAERSYTYEITYNNDDYPVEINRYRMSDNVLVSSLTFEYE